MTKANDTALLRNTRSTYSSLSNTHMQRFLLAAMLLLLAVTSALFFRLLSLDEQIKLVGVQVEQQAMLTNRALGKVIPLMLPDGIEEEIRTVESRLNDEQKWPSTPGDVAVLSASLASIVNKLPPWAQEELLPRLVPRRWEIETLFFLAEPVGGSIEARFQSLRRMEGHLSKAMDTVSEKLLKRLSEKAVKVEREIAESERSSALAAAHKAIAEKQSVEPALRGLAPYDDKEAHALIGQLNAALAIEYFGKDVDKLASEIDRGSKLVDPVLQELLFARLRNEIVDLRLRAALNGLLDSVPTKKLDSIEKVVVETNDKLTAARVAREKENIRQYQVWALGEIKKVRSFGELKAQEGKEISSAIDRVNPLSAANKEAIARARQGLKDDLLRLMAPINPSLLDDGAHYWYKKRLEKFMIELGDEQLQAEVVYAIATAPKQGLSGRK